MLMTGIVGVFRSDGHESSEALVLVESIEAVVPTELGRELKSE